MEKPPPLLGREKAEELGVNLVCDVLEVLGLVLELDLVHVDHQEAGLVVLDPVLVALVQAGDVVDADGSLVLAAALLDLRDEVRMELRR